MEQVQSVRRHFQNCHSEKEDKLDVPAIEMKCSKCSYQFSIRDKESRAQSRLNRHIQEVHGSVRDIECLLCNYRTKRKSNLEAHMNRIHEKKTNEQKQKNGASDDYHSQMSTNVIHLNETNEVVSLKKWGNATFVAEPTTYFI